MWTYKVSANAPNNPDVRDLYRDPNKLEQWKKQNAEKSKFFVTPLVDNIFKVHRPGKLTSPRGYVDPNKIKEYSVLAKNFGVTDAFVLLPDADMDEYYGYYASGTKAIKKGSGKEVLFTIYQRNGITPHHYPIPDYGIPNLKTVAVCCKDLDETSKKAKENNSKVIVHCSAGIGRTGLITSCYLVYTDRLNIDQIIQYERANSPEDFANLNSMQKLIKYDTNSQFDLICRFAGIKKKLGAVDLASEEGLAYLEKEDQLFTEKQKQKKPVLPSFNHSMVPTDDGYDSSEWDMIEVAPGVWKTVNKSYDVGNDDSGQTDYEAFFDSLPVGGQKAKAKGKGKSKQFESTIKITNVEGNLYRSSRPGYPSNNVPKEKAMADIEQMKKQGITDVVCLLSSEDMSRYYGDNVLPQLYMKNGINFHNFPIKDFGTPSVDDATRTCRTIDKLVKSGKKTLVHCSAGIGRTGLVISCYLLYSGLVKPDDNTKNNPLAAHVRAETSQQERFISDFADLIDQSSEPAPVQPNVQSEPQVEPQQQITEDNTKPPNE